MLVGILKFFIFNGDKIPNFGLSRKVLCGPKQGGWPMASGGHLIFWKQNSIIVSIWANKNWDKSAILNLKIGETQASKVWKICVKFEKKC